MIARLPPDEIPRLAELRRYNVLDTPPEQAFDDLTQLAAQICQVPMALVSLVDQDRQWFKARVGVEGTETPRDIAFCAHSILHQDEIFEIRDARDDPRFTSNPLVTEGPRIRFYAGAPLVGPGGHALGALCVMDRTPRTLTPEQLAALRTLSRAVVAQLELRRKTAELENSVGQHERAGVLLREKIEQLAAAEKEAGRLLGIAEKSRRGLLSVLEDEKRSGQSLRDSEERFRQMTESIDEMFYMTDPGNGALLYISPAYEKIWGRTRASLFEFPEKWVDAIHPEDRERVLAVAASKHLRGYQEQHYRILRPNGSVRWLRDRSFPVKDAGGKLIRMVGVTQDITEQKELETQFFRAQRLESIGTLASGIAHDLNNILAPIMMAAPLIRQSKSPVDAGKMLATIESSVQRGAKLVRQLLSFGRGEEGEKKSLPVGPIIEELVAIAQQTFPKNMTIAAILPKDLAPILADATQVHQILLNLCVNARDAMPHGGPLIISAENIHFDAHAAATTPGAKAGYYVLVKVTDTGTGMTPAVMEKIFDPFFTTKDVGKGSGLGLATVMGLTKSHGGFVTLTSELGKGSTFAVYFPVATTPGTEVPLADAAPSRGHGELLLLVDDEEAIRDSFRGVLIAHGYTVIVAMDGVEGTSRYALAMKEIQLVITDLDMPNMDGVTMIRVLKQMNPKAKIIVSSGLLQRNRMAPSRATELKALGVVAFLDKPYTATDLLQAIHKALAA